MELLLSVEQQVKFDDEMDWHDTENKDLGCASIFEGMSRGELAKRRTRLKKSRAKQKVINAKLPVIQLKQAA